MRDRLIEKVLNLGSAIRGFAKVEVVLWLVVLVAIIAFMADAGMIFGGHS